MRSTFVSKTAVAPSVLTLLGVCGMAVAGGPDYSNTLGTPGMGGSYIAALHPHDDGSGMKLYATGSFTASGVAGTSNLARWNGSAWESVGGGLINNYSNTLTTFQGDLIAGGYFDTASGVAGRRVIGAAPAPVSASLMAFRIAAGAAMAPACPTPLVPAGVVRQGCSSDRSSVGAPMSEARGRP